MIASVAFSDSTWRGYGTLFRVTIRLFLARSGDREGDREESGDVSPSSLNPGWIALSRGSFRRHFRRSRRLLRGSFTERRTVRIGGAGLLPFGSGTRNLSSSEVAGEEDDDVKDGSRSTTEYNMKMATTYTWRVWWRSLTWRWPRSTRTTGVAI